MEVAAWRAITSSYVHIALLAALLIVALLGGLLPQASSGLAVGSLRYQEWRGQLRPPWDASVDTLEALGLLRVFQSRPFYLLMALVAVVSGLRLASLWIPSWVSAPPPGASARDFVLPGDEAGAWEVLTRALRAVGLDVVRQVRHETTRYAAARRGGMARWGAGLLYLGVLALFLGAALEGRFGWVGPRLDLTLGETRPLGGESGLAVRLEQVALLPLAEGAWRRFDSYLSLLRGANVEGRLVLSLNRRATYRGLALYQLGFGPAVRLSAQQDAGQPLKIQPTVGETSAQRVLRLRFSGRQQEQALALPEADRVVRLVYYPSLPARGLSTRTLHVQILRGSSGELEAEQFLTENGQVKAGDVQVNIAFEYSVALRAEREPGLPLAALGGALIWLGLLGHLLWPGREVWAIIRPEAQGFACRLIVSRNDASAPWFAALAAKLSGEAHG